MDQFLINERVKRILNEENSNLNFFVMSWIAFDKKVCFLCSVLTLPKALSLFVATSQCGTYFCIHNRFLRMLACVMQFRKK